MTAARAGRKVIRTEEQVRATIFFFSTLDFAPYFSNNSCHHSSLVVGPVLCEGAVPVGQALFGKFDIPGYNKLYYLHRRSTVLLEQYALISIRAPDTVDMFPCSTRV